MNEIHGSNSEDPIQQLAGAVSQFGQVVDDFRHFLGMKKAGLIMQELGISNLGDEGLETALTDVFGTCVASGMDLGMKEQTDTNSVNADIDRLTSELPEPLRPSLARFIPTLVEEGIQFHRDELQPGDERVKHWQEEFTLFRSIGDSK